MGLLKSLSRKQKEAIGLLQIGTFLEYFDLMLYVHMAVLLNELFFPTTDPHTAALLAAFAFCSTYVLRPFGALIFGYIGDTIGRKSTVILTTTMMSVSCIVMANLPTYAQIGIAAAWLVTGCRIIQGLSSMGEVMGAMIYVAEITKPPIQYAAVTMVVLSASLGTMIALGTASLVTHFSMDWRIAFWIGAGIAVVGSMARTTLRETPEFLEMKRKKEIQSAKSHQKPRHLKEIRDKIKNNKDYRITLLFYFLVECVTPLCFYLCYIYFNPLLKSFGYSSSDIIFHNFLLAIIDFLFLLAAVYIVVFFHPLKILKIKAKAGILLALILPFYIYQATSVWQIFLVQALLMIAPGGSIPGHAIFIKNFDVSQRFTTTTFNFAASRAFMHIVSAFGLVYLTEWVGHWGIWLIALPVLAGFFWGIRHFEKLEGLRPDHPLSESPEELTQVA